MDIEKTLADIDKAQKETEESIARRKKYIEEARKSSRQAKDTQRLTKPIREWMAANKRVIRDLEKLLGELRRQERYIENRSYTPKTDVLKILKGGDES